MTNGDYYIGEWIAGGASATNVIASYRSYVAGEAISAANIPLSIHSDGEVYIMTASVESDVASFVGFSKTTAASGASIDVYLPYQRVSGFSGLTAGSEYHLNGNTLTATYSSLSVGEWTRSVGFADSASSIVVYPGPVIQVF